MAIVNFFKKTFNLKVIIFILLILWVLFSIFYIGYDLWSKFKLRIFTAGYQQGFTDSVRALIKQAETCQPIPIFEGNNRIEVINTKCIKREE